ncbi:DUF1003 domain-containing protein [bacterium]|nr:DUF1003 domain-containing protein [bacterium]
MKKETCSICQNRFNEAELFGSEIVRTSIQKLIARENKDWSENSKICNSCLDNYRINHLHLLLEQERGELSELDDRVLESLNEHETVTSNINSQYEEKLTTGQWLSDRIASFGGSWVFLISFALFMFAWIGFNMLGPKTEEFDPYPFILLNLVLSCLAAIQAPIIMMSQNRQEAKDRIRSEHDYLVNLKAELEVRQLNMKMDQLLKHQWHRLLEIQQLQVELLDSNKRNAMAKVNLESASKSAKDE